MKAIIMCEGLCKEPRWHRFVKKVCLEDEDKAGKYYYALMYECRKCGDVRVWGTEDLEDGAEAAE